MYSLDILPGEVTKCVTMCPQGRALRSLDLCDFSIVL